MNIARSRPILMQVADQNARTDKGCRFGNRAETTYLRMPPTRLNSFVTSKMANCQCLACAPPGHSTGPFTR